VGELHAGRQPSAWAAFRAVRDRFWSIVKVEIYTTVLVFAMAITIVGIPWAVMWLVRWMFTMQAVMLEGLRGRDALRASSNVVKHHWWQAALTNAVLSFLAAAVGPLVGLGLLIGLNVAQEISSGVSATLYAIVYPIAVIGFTLLDLRLKAAPARPAPAPAPEPVPGGVAPEPA
jgi:hypothetical protein